MSLTKVSYSMINGAQLNVLDYGADPTGVADSTSAIQAAIDAVPTQGGTVYIPAGLYLVNSTITVAKSFVNVVGDGGQASLLKFMPSTDGTACLEVKSALTPLPSPGGSAVIFGGIIRGLGFTSADNTYKKVALRCWDISSYIIDDIYIRGTVEVSGVGYFWTDPTHNSYGIVFRGREATNVTNIKIYADYPLYLGTNPNWPDIDVDHFRFENLYLVGNERPGVVIQSGVNLTQVEFAGYFIIAHCTYGIYWYDTESTTVSNGLTIRNLRFEQGTDDAAYIVYISHNYALQEFRIENSYLGASPTREVNGIYLRKCQDVMVSGTYYNSTTKQALNIDSTVSRFNIQNSQFQTGSTASITGQQLLTQLPKIGSGYPVSTQANYFPTASNTYNEIHNTAIAGAGVSLATGATTGIGVSGAGGMVIITTSVGLQGMFMLNGTNNTVFEISDPNTIYTTTAGNANTINVYWSAGNSRYEVQNNTASTVLFKFTYLGTGGSFAVGG